MGLLRAAADFAKRFVNRFDVRERRRGWKLAAGHEHGAIARGQLGAVQNCGPGMRGVAGEYICNRVDVSVQHAAAVYGLKRFAEVGRVIDVNDGCAAGAAVGQERRSIAARRLF